MDGVKECVFGFPERNGVFGAVEPRVPEIEGLGVRCCKPQRTLDAGEIQAVDIEGLPKAAGRSAIVVDVIALAAFEYGEAGMPVGTRVPIDTAFVIPGPFRAKIRIADVGWVLIVQLRVAGHAEGTA